MDPNATAPANPNFFPPPPPGLNYIAAIQPSLVFLMIGTVWSAILVPLLVALFFFSTKESRRTPIFVLNFLSIMLGLVMGIYNAVLEIHAVLSPLQPFAPGNFMAFSVLISFTPWLVETILLVRLLAVYPYSRTPKRLWYSIFIPLALIKVGRFANNTIYTIEYIDFLTGPGAGNPITNAQTTWNTHPGIKIEWILQVIDNTATSILFINRLKIGLDAPERVGSGSSHTSYAARIKGLFWIAVSNFVFPTILSIVQLIFLFRDRNFLKGTYIFITNDYVEIIGVLLATVWASSNHWTDQPSSTQLGRSEGLESNPRFGGSQSQSGIGSFGGSFNTIRVNVATKKDTDIELGHLESQPEFADVEKKRSLSS